MLDKEILELRGRLAVAPGLVVDDRELNPLSRSAGGLRQLLLQLDQRFPVLEPLIGRPEQNHHPWIAAEAEPVVFERLHAARRAAQQIPELDLDFAESP